MQKRSKHSQTTAHQSQKQKKPIQTGETKIKLPTFHKHQNHVNGRKINTAENIVLVQW
jgi:hypothetical protein